VETRKTWQLGILYVRMNVNLVTGLGYTPEIILPLKATS